MRFSVLNWQAWHQCFSIWMYLVSRSSLKTRTASRNKSVTWATATNCSCYRACHHLPFLHSWPWLISGLKSAVLSVRCLRALSMKDLGCVFLTQSRLGREVCPQLVSVWKDTKPPEGNSKEQIKIHSGKKDRTSKKRAALIAHHRRPLTLKQLQLKTKMTKPGSRSG